VDGSSNRRNKAGFDEPHDVFEVHEDNTCFG